MAEPPVEAARELREELLEILKQLNRDEMEAEETPGVEPGELRHLLARGPLPQVTDEQVRRALETLIGNGYVRELTDPRWAWSRGRTVAERFTITTEGKAFLARALEKVGRI
jgi:hypothetical protein